MSKFFSKLNVKQLGVHFIAYWFFIYSFRTLAYLYDYKILTSDSVMMYQVIFKERFANDLLIIGTAGLIGLLIAFIISRHLSVINNWFSSTPAVVLLITLPLYYFNLLGWGKLQYIFLAPGQIFSAWNNVITLLVNGIIMLSIGLFLLFNKRIIAFINKGVKSEK